MPYGVKRALEATAVNVEQPASKRSHQTSAKQLPAADDIPPADCESASMLVDTSGPRDEIVCEVVGDVDPCCWYR